MPLDAQPVLVDDDLSLTPLRHRDRREWLALVAREERWLAAWMATSPTPTVPMSFREQLRAQHREARAGTGLTYVLRLDGVLAGSVVARPIVREVTWTASIGYWVAERMAGRRLAPRAVALVMDHLFDDLGMHRVEIDVRPENAASLRVVERLGLREEGYRRGLMHVDGDWRDHRSFAMLAGDLGPGHGAVLRHLHRRG